MLEELEVRRALLDSVEGRDALREEYERALATIGQRVRVEQHDGARTGLALGVDERGATARRGRGRRRRSSGSATWSTFARASEVHVVSRATRVLVTGAAGQVGVDLMDVLDATTPLGGDPTFQPDARRSAAGEFEALGLTRHELDVTDRDAVATRVRAPRGPTSSCTSPRTPPSIAPKKTRDAAST